MASPPVPIEEFDSSDNTRKRMSPLAFVAAITVFALVAFVVFAAVVGSMQSKQSVEGWVDQQVMPDGTILTLEKVTYGKTHEFEFEQANTEFGFIRTSRTRKVSHTTGKDRIVIWLTRKDPVTGQPLDLDQWSHSIAVGSNGCNTFDANGGRNAYYDHGSRGTRGSRPFNPLPPASSGSYDKIVGSSEVRPVRHDGDRFNLKIIDVVGTTIAEFSVPDPTPEKGNYSEWKPEPIPASKQIDDLSVNLVSLLAVKRNRTQRQRTIESTSLRPQFQILHNGLPAEHTWRQSSVMVSDAVGNIYSPYDCKLCPSESAWKLTLTLHRNPDGKFESSELTPALEIDVPKQQTGTRLSLTQSHQGIDFEILAIGQGRVTYSGLNPHFSGSSSSSGGVRIGKESVAYSVRSESNRGRNTTTIDSRAIHLVIDVSELPEGIRFPDLIVTDPDGKRMKIGERPIHQHGLTVWFIESPDKSTKLQAQFIIQKEKAFEFFVKPPEAIDLDSLPPKERSLALAQMRIDQLEANLKAYPDNAMAHNNLAWELSTCTAKLRDPKRAVALAELGLEMDPKNRLIQNTLGVAYYRNDQLGDAKSLLEANASRFNDGLVCFDLYFLAMAQFRDGERDAAKKTYERANELQKKHSKSLSTQYRNELSRFITEALTLILGHHPNDFFGRGNQLAQKGNWEKAAEQFQQGLKYRATNHHHWYASGCLQLQLGNRGEYRRHCTTLLENFAHASADAYIIERTCKLALMVPSDDPVDRRLDRLTSLLVDRGENNGSFLLCGGMYKFRVGEYHDAILLLDRADQNDGNSVHIESLALLFRAMAHKKLKEDDKAREFLSQATTLMDQKMPQPNGKDFGTSWQLWIMCQVLRKEAETTISNER